MTNNTINKLSKLGRRQTKGGKDRVYIDIMDTDLELGLKEVGSYSYFDGEKISNSRKNQAVGCFRQAYIDLETGDFAGYTTPCYPEQHAIIERIEAIIAEAEKEEAVEEVKEEAVEEVKEEAVEEVKAPTTMTKAECLAAVLKNHYMKNRDDYETDFFIRKCCGDVNDEEQDFDKLCMIIAENERSKRFAVRELISKFNESWTC